MQKAVLRSPSTSSGKELPGLIVSVLAPLRSLCSSAICAPLPGYVKHRHSCWGSFRSMAGSRAPL